MKEGIKKLIVWADKQPPNSIELTYKQIADKFGIHHSSVGRILNKLGIKTIVKPGPKPTIKLFCNHGHEYAVVERDKRGNCKECERLRSKKYKEEHKAELKIKNKKYNDKIRERRLKYNNEHKKERQEYIKIWRGENTEALKEYSRQYRREHPALYKLGRLKYRTNLNLRIVSWGQDGIYEFYEKCPVDMTVDHIIPLQGDLVSGLHVSWNLQYLTPSANSKKRNKINLMDATKLYEKILRKAGLK